jgi:hypothetical protein
MSIVCVWSALHNNDLDSHAGSAQRHTNLTSTMRPGTSPELVTANLCLFVPEYTQHEFGLVLLLANSVIFNVQFIIVHRPNCIRGLLVGLNHIKMEF